VAGRAFGCSDIPGGSAVTFRVGTSGWSYKHWNGVFYPRGVSGAKQLPFYAERLSTVEINNSFYRLPKESSWRKWKEAVPRDFEFAVKASRYITHTKRLMVEPRSIEKVMDGAKLLGGHLGPVLYQLPRTFERSTETVARLERFLDMLPGDNQNVIEFRHDSWLEEPVFSLLRASGTSFCIVDMPKKTYPLEVTGSCAYVRFHGHERLYASKYSGRELKAWARRLRRLEDVAGQVYCYFNNDAAGYAVENARELEELLRKDP
jgi:uncharacterized protein YecE (DUF72 family)